LNNTKQIEKIENIVQAAVQTFIQSGYRLAQVSDIARKAKISPGTIYLYFESKEALFDFVVRYAARSTPPKEWPDIPIPTPPLNSTINFVMMRVPTIFPVLFGASKLDNQDDTRNELEHVIREMYRVFFAKRHYIRLMDSSTRDWPQLAEVWDKGIRKNVVATLERYIQNRIRQNVFLEVIDTWATARSIVEMLNWFATHRPDMPDHAGISDETAEKIVVQIVSRILLPATE